MNHKSKTAKKKSTVGSERRYQRATCRFPAEFTWGTITHPATVHTLSLGGCYLESEVLVPAGESLSLSFIMNDPREPVTCEGKVAWVAPRGIMVNGKRRRGFAISFQRVYPEQRARIDEFTKKRVRIFKTIIHELKKEKPDKALIKQLFAEVRPGESLHLNHIKAVCRVEQRYFRLRK